jgi:glycosyltransferase involved in cell wall biosynthesis
MNARPVRIGFMMDQIAGHITNYRNLRRVVDADPTLQPTWCEIEFHKADGAIERASRRLRFVPPYLTGVGRGSLELRRGLSSGEFDVLYTNSSVAAFFVRRFQRTPTLLHLDSTPKQIDEMPTYPSPNDPAPIAALKKRMSTRLFTSVDAIQAWSAWARQSFIDDYGVRPDRVTVNPPGIETARWRPPSIARGTELPVRVLFVGGDFERKGGKLLLEWWKTTAPGTVELSLVTRDPVPPQPGVEVHRDLVVNSPALVDLFHRSDVFALPSLGECFGIATVEAMAAGLPAVASDVGGTADIIQHGRTGFIVTAGDQSSLNEAMNRLVADPALRSTMGAMATDVAVERFDVGLTARRTIDALRRIAAPLS